MPYPPNRAAGAAKRVIVLTSIGLFVLAGLCEIGARSGYYHPAPPLGRSFRQPASIRIARRHRRK